MIYNQKDKFNIIRNKLINMKKYKCLALPGWLNDAELMKSFLTQLEKVLASVVTFEYLDPSYDVSKSIIQLPSNI